MSLTEKSLDLIVHLQKVYFEQRDMEAALAQMAEDIQWVGTEEGEIFKGLEQTASFMQKEKERSQSTFEILDCEYTAEEVAPGVCSVVGAACIRENTDDEGVMALTVRVSAVCTERDGVVKLRQFHLSIGGENQDEESIFPRILPSRQAKEAQEALQIMLQRYQIVMDQATDIVFEWDVKNDQMYYSPNWEKRFGYQPITEHASTELPLGAHIHPDDVYTLKSLIAETVGGKEYSESELRIARQDGVYLWCRVRVTLQTDRDGTPLKAIGVIIDIDQEKRRADLMKKRAERDMLTGLYNKGTVQALVEKQLCTVGKKNVAALLIIDVDNFKQINDIYGHLSGDAMLADVAGILQNMFRTGDIVGRIGGDEFIVFLKNVYGKENVTQRAKDILAAFQSVLGKNEKRIELSCSIGIAMAPEAGKDFFSLYKNADIALYDAKMKGKHTFSFFTPALPVLVTKETPIYGSTVGDGIDSDRVSGAMSQALAEYVFYTLYQSEDIETAIPLILEIVGRKFDVSRVYIFEDTEDGEYCSNTFEWCNEGIVAQKDFLQNVPYEELDHFDENFDENGIFYCRDICKLSPKQKEILEVQGIKSMLQCAIQDDGKKRGFVGFDECGENRFWTQEQIDALSLVAAVVSIFLLKKRAQVRTDQALKSLEIILDHQDAWIYAVEKDSHRILYANSKTKEAVPALHVGEKCHKAFFGFDEPCEDCPGKKLTKRKQKADAVVYSEILDSKVLAKARSIPWLGERDVFLMSCEGMKKTAADGD